MIEAEINASFCILAGRRQKEAFFESETRAVYDDDPAGGKHHSGSQEAFYLPALSEPDGKAGGDKSGNGGF